MGDIGELEDSDDWEEESSTQKLSEPGEKKNEKQKTAKPDPGVETGDGKEKISRTTANLEKRNRTLEAELQKQKEMNKAKEQKNNQTSSGRLALETQLNTIAREKSNLQVQLTSMKEE